MFVKISQRKLRNNSSRKLLKRRQKRMIRRKLFPKKTPLLQVRMKALLKPCQRQTSIRSRSLSVNKIRRLRPSKSKSSSTRRSLSINLLKMIIPSRDTRKKSTKPESSPSQSLPKTFSMLEITFRWAITSSIRSRLMKFKTLKS